ncbi:MAG: GIY-YIG nuclease family protein [Candidatus Ratteibacteria bacterium]|nr:GIY-YIG nuclease family protein [Candidatus Ratteibacteria bacterium]
MKKIIKHSRFYVYIVKCQDKTYYTGYTPDVERRIELHNSGKGAKYTRDRRPVKLVWCKEYRYLHYAMSAEYRIKRLNKRQKILLIRGMCLDKVMSKKRSKG